MLAHDAQCAAAGVTTVLDALCLGDLGFDKDRITHLPRRRGRPRRAGRHRAAEEPTTSCTCAASCRPPTCWSCWTRWPTTARAHGQPDGPLARASASTPTSTATARMRRREGVPPRRASSSASLELQEQRARLRGPNRRALLARMAERRRAARQPRRPHRGRDRGEPPRRHPHQRVPGHAWPPPRPRKRRGMQVIAGAPNIVRGGSHSGNVAAAELVREPARWTRWRPTTCRPA